MTGPKGPAGATGPIGPMGNIGKQGIIGGIGPVGPQGISGVPGRGFNDSTLSLIKQQINPYFSKQKCTEFKISGPSFKCPPNHYLSGIGGLSKDGRFNAPSATCCYGIGSSGPVAILPPKNNKYAKPSISLPKPTRPNSSIISRIAPPPKPKSKIRVSSKSKSKSKGIGYDVVEKFGEMFTQLGQSATAPNIMNAQRVMVEQEARAIQLRNLLGTGQQLVTKGNRSIISGGGTVLRVGDEVSPALMDRIRLAERGPVPDSFLGTGR